MEPEARSVLITGAAGYIGRLLVHALAAERSRFRAVVAVDIRDVPPAERVLGIEYRSGDVRDPHIAELLREHRIDTVVHLAAIVTPGRGISPEMEYSIDVRGTENVLEACASTGVRKLIVTSSGAAYGYHADNPRWLRETDPLRGNEEFAYSRHKRLVEEILARYRREHPELRQLVFRPGTILGAGTNNQITALFEKPVILGIRGAPTPFVFIWDQDVVACLRKAIHEEGTGTYNLAGDGVMTLAAIARRTGKLRLPLPAPALRAALRLMHPLGLTQYGPEQIDFLRYRPVLANDKLKTEFGYTPQLTSAQVFERYWTARAARGRNCASLQGKTAVITGAASGIGRALAMRLARAGARLGLLDRNGTALEELASALRARGATVHAATCDVSRWEDCRTAMQSFVDALGGIDVLINNAGITHLGTFAETDVGVFRKVMNVNLFGALHCTKAALPSLAERRGLIVVLSSVAGFAPLAGRSGYAASKHALHGLFESLRAEEHRSGVRVLLVCPGFTRTNIGKSALGADGLPARVPRTMTGREAEPEQVAEAIYRGVMRRRRLLVLSPAGRLSYVLSRLCPAAYERIMARLLINHARTGTAGKHHEENRDGQAEGSESSQIDRSLS